MKSALTVKDIMVPASDTVTLGVDTTLVEAAEVLARHGFDGVPIVDKDKKLLGILTEYDLISKKSVIHLPTFQLVLQNLSMSSEDKEEFRKEMRSIKEMTVKDVMNTEPTVLQDDATYEEVVATFRDHHRVNPIPVVDKNHIVVGVVSRFDVLKPLRSFIATNPGT